MGKYIRILTIFYDTEIGYKEIPLFRGAVLKSLSDKANVLYHNHIGDSTYRYSYPLIQYKRLNGKAAITCIAEGADIIGQFLSEGMKTLILGDRIVEIRILKVVPSRMAVQLWKTSFTYELKRWLPLNGKNYHLYQLAENDQEKKELLEKILRGNLLSMLKGLNIFVEEELIVKIVRPVRLKSPYQLAIRYSILRFVNHSSISPLIIVAVIIASAPLPFLDHDIPLCF